MNAVTRNRPSYIKRIRELWLSVFVTTALVAFTVWVMLAPIKIDTRETLIEIPAGTWERRAAGHKADIFPSEIRLTLGVNNILVLRNLDRVPQIFGPVLLMPGQSIKLPFKRAAESQLICAAHSSGRITVIVDPEPTAGWRRLMWRLTSAIRLLKDL